MGRLNLNIQGYNNALDTITINGKACKVIRNRREKTTSVSMDVEGDVAHVIIYKPHAYVGKHWLLWSLIYFIVSIFGVFDTRYHKRNLIVDCRFDVITYGEDTNVNATVLTYRDKEPFLKIESDASITEIANTMYCDLEAKKKAKIAKRAKIFVFLAVVAIIAAIVLL